MGVEVTMGDFVEEKEVELMDEITNSVSTDDTVSTSNQYDKNDPRSFNFLKDGSPRLIIVKCGFKEEEDD